MLPSYFVQQQQQNAVPFLLERYIFWLVAKYQLPSRKQWEKNLLKLLFSVTFCVLEKALWWAEIQFNKQTKQLTQEVNIYKSVSKHACGWVYIKQHHNECIDYIYYLCNNEIEYFWINRLLLNVKKIMNSHIIRIVLLRLSGYEKA